MSELAPKPDNDLVPHPPLKDYYDEESQRRTFVSSLFDKTAHNYDWIIRAMSLGSGNYYRYQALLRAGLKGGMQVLDVATGTGPVADAIRRIVGSQGSVTGLDRSINMLKETQQNVKGIPLIQSDAAALPFPANSFDFLSMGYALRHVDSLESTFAEYFRVLKPGGKMLLMELTSPDSKLGLMITKFYMRSIVPLVAKLGTGSQDSKTLMAYFWDTIENCVRPNIIMDTMAKVDFEDVNRHVSIGIFSEYTAVKPASK